MAVFDILESSKLISRKIWVILKSWFHNVNLEFLYGEFWVGNTDFWIPGWKEQEEDASHHDIYPWSTFLLCLLRKSSFSYYQLLVPHACSVGHHRKKNYVITSKNEPQSLFELKSKIREKMVHISVLILLNFFLVQIAGCRAKFAFVMKFQKSFLPISKAEKWFPLCKIRMLILVHIK